jgi:DNA-binding transcriptional regulator YiaG
MDGPGLRQWREARGWSMRELARRLGVAPSTVLRWERVEGEMPGLLVAALRGVECEEADVHNMAVSRLPDVCEC